MIADWAKMTDNPIRNSYHPPEKTVYTGMLRGIFAGFMCF